MAQVVLVGLPGAGKSSVGRRVASLLRSDFVDTDDVVARLAGVPSAVLLVERGEAAFREIEERAVREALAGEGVVATGGGAVSSSSTRELLRSELTIWLDGDDEVLLRRLDVAKRPLLAGDTTQRLATLRRERSAWYEEVSRQIVDARADVDEVARRVVSIVNEWYACA